MQGSLEKQKHSHLPREQDGEEGRNQALETQQEAHETVLPGERQAVRTCEIGLNIETKMCSGSSRFSPGNPCYVSVYSGCIQDGRWEIGGRIKTEGKNCFIKTYHIYDI